MQNKWQLQDAKNRLSKVVDEAIHRNPQIITLRGKEVVIVLAIEDYRKLVKSKVNLVKFLQNSPLCGAQLDLTRDNEYTTRETDL
jgi:prevent-host-death family protein